MLGPRPPNKTGRGELKHAGIRIRAGPPKRRVGVNSMEKGCGFVNIAICCGCLASSCLVERNNLLYFSDDNYSFFFCSGSIGCGVVVANKTLPVTAFTTYLKWFRCQMGGNLSCETPGGTVIK